MEDDRHRRMKWRRKEEWRDERTVKDGDGSTGGLFGGETWGKPEVRSVADSCLFVVGTVRPQTRGVPVATALCIRTALGWLVTDVCGCGCICARVLMCTLVSLVFWIDWDESSDWCGVGCCTNYVLHVIAQAALSCLSVTRTVG